MTVRFTIPGPPVTVNRLYGRRRDGGVYVRPEARQYKSSVALIAHRAKHQQNGGHPFDGDCQITLRMFFPNRRMDGDNAMKATIDGIAAGGVVVNDRQFKRYVIDKLLDPENPRTEVEVDPL